MNPTYFCDSANENKKTMYNVGTTQYKHVSSVLFSTTFFNETHKKMWTLCCIFVHDEQNISLKVGMLYWELCGIYSPTKIFFCSLNQACNALNSVQLGNHIGKIVIHEKAFLHRRFLIIWALPNRNMKISQNNAKLNCMPVGRTTSSGNIIVQL